MGDRRRQRDCSRSARAIDRQRNGKAYRTVRRGGGSAAPNVRVTILNSGEEPRKQPCVTPCGDHPSRAHVSQSRTLRAECRQGQDGAVSGRHLQFGDLAPPLAPILPRKANPSGDPWQAPRRSPSYTAAWPPPVLVALPLVHTTMHRALESVTPDDLAAEPWCLKTVARRQVNTGKTR